MKRSWGYGTDQRLRNENQDSYGVFDYPEFTIAIVCDGMGGHVGGAQASCIGVRQTHDVLLENKEQPVSRGLQLAIEQANKAIHDTARKNHRLMGMGTTIAAVVIRDGVATVAHVGDSRVYLVRDGEVRSLTRDHTMVNLFVEAELLSPEDAATHPEAHVLSRSLGVERTVEVEVSEPVELENEDALFLCSDGVHSVITDWELGNLDWEKPNAAIQTVMKWVEEREGDDNATAVAVAMTQSDENVPVSELPDPETKLKQLLAPAEGEVTSSGRILPPAIIGDEPDEGVGYYDEDDGYGDDAGYGEGGDAGEGEGGDDGFVSYGNQPEVIYYDDDDDSDSDSAEEPSRAQDAQGTEDKQWVVDSRNPDDIRRAEEEKRRKEEEEAKKKAEEEKKKGGRGKKALVVGALVVLIGAGMGGLGLMAFQNMPKAQEGRVVVDGPGQEGVTQALDPTAEIVITGPEGEQRISPENGQGSIQVETEPQNGEPFFEADPPASPRRLPHRATYYTAPPPGGPKQFLAVNAARNRDCPAALDTVQEAMRDSIDHAQLYQQAWYCFDGTHSQPLVSARVFKPQRFETVLHHFEGTPKRPEEDKGERLPHWFLPPGGGIEYRLMAFIDPPEEENDFPSVMRDLLGEPKITDHLGKDLYLEAVAAEALAEIERPTNEMIQWRARRVYVLARALDSDLGRMLRTHRPDLVPTLEEALEKAAMTPLPGFSSPPKAVTEAYEVGTGEKEPPKAGGRRTPKPVPAVLPPDPEPVEPEPFEVKVHKVAPSQRPLDDGSRN